MIEVFYFVSALSAERERGHPIAGLEVLPPDFWNTKRGRIENRPPKPESCDPGEVSLCTKLSARCIHLEASYGSARSMKENEDIRLPVSKCSRLTFGTPSARVLRIARQKPESCDPGEVSLCTKLSARCMHLEASYGSARSMMAASSGRAHSLHHFFLRD